MSIEEPTFGCGALLPGKGGGGNFPDFTGGGVIDGGGEWSDGTTDGPGIEIVDPIEPGGPSPPGQGPPSTGRPTGPGTPGTGGKCQCKVFSFQEQPSVPTTGGDGCDSTTYTVIFTQVCGAVPAGQQNHFPDSETSVNLYYESRTQDIENYEYGPPQITGGPNGQIGGENCKENGSCGGDCPDITLVWTETERDCSNPGDDNSCYCVYGPPTVTQIPGQGPDGAQSNCTRFRALFQGDCQSLPEPPADTVGDYVAEIAASPDTTGEPSVSTGTVSVACGGTQGNTGCGGQCANKIVTWYQCDGVDQTKIDPGTIIVQEGIVGCMREDDPNYNPLATVSDPSMCALEKSKLEPGTVVVEEVFDIVGCMREGDPNFNPLATINDPSMCYYDSTKVDPGAPIIDTSTIIIAGPQGGGYTTAGSQGTVFTGVTGCTQQWADNYNPNANQDDGSCYRVGCTNPEANNYDPLATVDSGNCILVSTESISGGVSFDGDTILIASAGGGLAEGGTPGTGTTVFTRPTEYDTTFVFQVNERSPLDIVEGQPQTLTPKFWNPETVINDNQTIVYAQGSNPEVDFFQAVASTEYNVTDESGSTDTYHYQNQAYYPGQPVKVIISPSTGEVTLYNITGSFLPGKNPVALNLEYQNSVNAGGEYKKLTIPINISRPPGTDTYDDDPDEGEPPLGLLAGKGQTSKSSETKESLTNQAVEDGVIDLNDPRIIKNILKKKPAGIQDSDVAFLTTHAKGTFIPNETGHTDIFAARIDSNIAYVLKNRRNSGDWDSEKASGVTIDSVYNSLSIQVKNLFNEIRNYDGTAITQNQIFDMIGTRILDGTVARITLRYLQNLAESSKKRNKTVILRSSIDTVNEVAAAALIDKNKFSLDPSKSTGRMANILPNWKTLATDIDQYLPITIAGKEQRFYIKDDNTFIASPLGENLTIKDGNYIDITRGGKTQRLFTKSEIDHAFIIPEATRQKALSLLGAETGRTLEVSAPGTSSGIEFDYSLTAPRQNFYVLSAVLSSIVTEPSPTGSFLLKDSTTQYDLVDTSTAAGLAELNTYIKYKANHRVFILDDEDLIFDYLDGTGKMTVKQTDILFDSPKTNKATPLLTRQIPWYILVYPTNRSDYNLFNSKSNLVSISKDGAMIRNLKCRTSIVPEFSKGQTNKFVTIKTDGKEAVDVLGVTNPQTRITVINENDAVFKTGYKKRNTFVAAKEFVGTRKKTGFRLIKEIINELDTNYLLGLNGKGKIVTEFDVFSRLYLNQFTALSRLENFTQIRDSVRNGLINNVKVIPPVSHSDADLSYRSTLLLQKKVGSPEDTFTPIKGTRNRETIIPPSTTGGSSFAPVPNPAVRTTPT
jgi:hypothetical protein